MSNLTSSAWQPDAGAGNESRVGFFARDGLERRERRCRATRRRRASASASASAGAVDAKSGSSFELR